MLNIQWPLHTGIYVSQRCIYEQGSWRYSFVLFSAVICLLIITYPNNKIESFRQLDDVWSGSFLRNITLSVELRDCVHPGGSERVASAVEQHRDILCTREIISQTRKICSMNTDPLCFNFQELTLSKSIPPFKLLVHWVYFEKKKKRREKKERKREKVEYRPCIKDLGDFNVSLPFRLDWKISNQTRR